MSHRVNSSLDDTIPLKKRAYDLSSSNQTYYGSDFSNPSKGNSKDSSVRIVHEVIDLTRTNSNSNQGATPTQGFIIKNEKASKPEFIIEFGNNDNQ